MASSDQAERELEISKLIQQNNSIEMIRAAAKANQTLDIEKFEKDMFLLKLRLGYYNKRKIQENKIGMLS